MRLKQSLKRHADSSSRFCNLIVGLVLVVNRSVDRSGRINYLGSLDELVIATGGEEQVRTFFQ